MHWFMVLAALALSSLAQPASAQTAGTPWPTRPVKILIPFTAGGTADTLGRLAAQKLSEALGQQFVPENKPGASGLIAAAETVNSPPDGYTLFVSGVGGLIIASAITPNPPADVITGYTHIVNFGGPPAVLLVHNDVPAKTLKELAPTPRPIRASSTMARRRWVRRRTSPSCCSRRRPASACSMSPIAAAARR